MTLASTDRALHVHVRIRLNGRGVYSLYVVLSMLSTTRSVLSVLSTASDMKAQGERNGTGYRIHFLLEHRFESHS